MPEADPPTLPDGRLAGNGWTLVETEAETVFRGLGVSVTGHTAVYEDAGLRDRIVATGGRDRIWRFFFATQLDIRPSPAAGLASAARPYVVRESKSVFAGELADRGFRHVEYGDTETVRLDDHRARRSALRARLPVAGGAVDVSGALVVWHDGGFRVAGGAYPTDARAAWPDIDPDAYEDDLFDLIGAAA
ncbi:hypothetical protein BRC85_06115 [Halobacteriales archaeon QS_1_69_70]|nr:MAG: hypothetical protein BRC85_06115 [Halobacteriales archaeon QS_1_69_70]